MEGLNFSYAHPDDPTEPKLKELIHSNTKVVKLNKGDPLMKSNRRQPKEAREAVENSWGLQIIFRPRPDQLQVVIAFDSAEEREKWHRSIQATINAGARFQLAN